MRMLSYIRMDYGALAGGIYSFSVRQAQGFLSGS